MPRSLKAQGCRRVVEGLQDGEEVLARRGARSWWNPRYIVGCDYANASSAVTWTSGATLAAFDTAAAWTVTEVTTSSATPYVWRVPLDIVTQWEPLLRQQLTDQVRMGWVPARDETWEIRLRQQQLERERAIARAEALLLEHLTPQQQYELRDKGHFHIETIDSATGETRRYRIQRGRHGNIQQVDQRGNALKQLCVHPTLDVPDADTMLAQMLHLRFNEQAILRTANIRQIRA